MLQEKLIFPGPSLSSEYKFFIPPHLTVKEVHLDKGSAHLHGFYVQASQSQGVVLFFHGNGGSVQDWITVADRFVDRGFDILIMDYRGYGKSRGERSQALLLEDAEAAYEYLRKDWPDRSILVYGRSLGSGFASYIAARHPVGCLMMETPYLSLLKISKDRFPYLPVNYLMQYPMPSREYLTQVDCPIFLIHGTADRVIPVQHSQELSRIPQNKYVVYEEVAGGTHHDLELYPQYRDWLEEGLEALPSAQNDVE